MKDERPLDYEKIETYEEFLNSGWGELGLWGRITYHLQDHVWKAIFVGSALGYIAGTYFGKFW